jgi:membrane protein DedA with SNARE-associated domain
VLVLGVAARVGEISMGVAFLGGLVGAVAGGVITWSIARRLTRPSSEGP